MDTRAKTTSRYTYNNPGKFIDNKAVAFLNNFTSFFGFPIFPPKPVSDDKPGKEDYSKNALIVHMVESGGVANSDTSLITSYSMRTKNQALGDSWIASLFKAEFVLAAATMKIYKFPCRSFYAEDAVALKHGQDTGIFKLDGTIDESPLKKIEQNYCEKDKDNQLILKKESFYKFLYDKRNQATTLAVAKPSTCPLSFFTSKHTGGFVGAFIDKIVSNDEWSAFWEKASSKAPDGSQYVTFQEFSDFYHNPRKFIEKVEAKVIQQNAGSRQCTIL